MKKGKGLVNILRRRVAGFIALTLVVTAVLPYAGNIGLHLVSADTAYADASTELQPESAPQEDATSDTTIFKWILDDRSDNDWDSNTVKIDFRGKYNSNATSYDPNDSTNQFKITYGNHGYEVKVLIGDNPIGASAAQGQRVNFGGGNPANANGSVETIDGIEFKTVLKPSADKKYILWDLYAFNTNTTAKYLNMRLTADTQVYSDSSRVVLNEEDKLIHMVYDNSTSANYISFDIINQDNNIKLDPFNVAWAGYYGHRGNSSNAWASYVEDWSGGSDSGASLGWKNIYINPNEKVHKRVAVLTRTSTIYVNADVGVDTTSGTSATGGRRGSFDMPFKTVDYALDFANNKGWSKYFVCLQTNNELPSINLNSSNRDITFQSADLNANGRRNNNVYTLKVNETSQVNVSDGKITFSDIIIDGKNKERTNPFIKLTGSGTVGLSSGTIIKNLINKNGAAAVDCSGASAKLNVYGTEISNCVSYSTADTNNCAITYKGGNTNFEMNGVNKIWNNRNNYGTPSNIYLNSGTVIQVSHYLWNETNKSDLSRISVRTEDLPEAYVGNIKAANQEQIIARMVPGVYPDESTTGNCPFEACFQSDDGQSDGSILVAEGRYAGHEKYTIIKRPGNKISYRFIKDTGLAFPSSIITRADEQHAVGESLTIATPNTIPAGYDLDRVQIAGNGFTANNDKNSPNFGQVTGTMQDSNVTITYVYKPKDVKISFTTNGGSPNELSDIVGKIGRNVAGVLPILTKYGYLHDG